MKYGSLHRRQFLKACAGACLAAGAARAADAPVAGAAPAAGPAPASGPALTAAPTQATAPAAPVPATAPAAATRAAKPPRPNFIFILVDDLRFDAIGCANPVAKTPSIDALARRGTRFTEMFVTTSICSPSRACCLTGRYGSRTGVTGLSGPTAQLREGEKTFAQYLGEAGYRTGFVGKWHLAKATPKTAGFDSFTYFTANGPHHDRQVITADGPAVAKGFIEDYNADWGVRFMESAAGAGEPFCLHLCTQVPHMTLDFGWDPAPEFLALYDEARMTVPASWRDDLSGKPPYLARSRFRTQGEKYGYATEAGIRAHRRQYLAIVSQMDRSLGRLVEACGRLGLWENTYVFLMGDNGWFMGEHGFTSKVLAYEESMRVPLVVAGPGLEGAADGHLVLNADLAPTMLDLAGLPVPGNMHGRSLAPLLGGRSLAAVAGQSPLPGGRATPPALVGRAPPLAGQAPIAGGQAPPWRESILYEALAPELSSWPLVAVRTRDFKYIQTFDLADRSQTAFEELYDLRSDPGEMKNLAPSPEHRETLDRLKDELARLRAGLPA
jgi:arylsulfatase A-like enzyme